MGIFDIFKGDDGSAIPGDTDSSEFAHYIIEAVHERRTPIIINFRGVQQQYVSMVIDVDHRKNIVVLDELSPSDGHQRALSGDQFRISTSDHGVAVVWKSRVIDSGSENGIAFYHIPLPDRVEYVQRRDSFRLYLNSSERIHVSIQVRNKQISDSFIHDISFTGINITLPGKNYEDQLQPGSIIEKLSFLIDPGNLDEGIKPKYFVADSIVKRVKYNKDSNSTSVALMFHRLELPVQRQLNVFICDLERKQLQKKQDGLV